MTKPKTNYRQPNKKSLLDLAREFKVYPNREITNEEIDLMLAWLNGEIGIKQYAHAMQMKKGVKILGGSVLYRISVILKEALKRKMVEIKKL